MQREIQVWGPRDTETVTILASKSAGVRRVIWHKNGDSVEFEVEPTGGDTVEQAIQKELRRRRESDDNG